MCLEDAHFGEGKVVIPVDTKRVHHFSMAWWDDESWLSSGIAIWSFLCSFLYTLNAGVSNTIMILL